MGKKNGHALDTSKDFAEDPQRPKPEDEGGDGPGEGHNSEARLAAEAAAIEEWCSLQEQEDKLIEKYIDPIRKKKQDVKADLKSEYEVPTEAFNARAALRKIERRSDKDEVVLMTHELFQALPVGKNLDLVAIGERVAAKKAEKAAAVAAKKTQATATEAVI